MSAVYGMNLTERERALLRRLDAVLERVTQLERGYEELAEIDGVPRFVAEMAVEMLEAG